MILSFLILLLSFIFLNFLNFQFSFRAYYFHPIFFEAIDFFHLYIYLYSYFSFWIYYFQWFHSNYLYYFLYWSCSIQYLKATILFYQKLIIQTHLFLWIQCVKGVKNYLINGSLKVKSVLYLALFIIYFKEKYFYHQIHFLLNSLYL